jgi:hypothetical protein
MTHNTRKCYKYNKDGNPVAAAAVYLKKPYKKGVTSSWLI